MIGLRLLMFFAVASLGLLLLGHYGWPLPAGVFCLWWARNIEQRLDQEIKERKQP